ncbi:MAG: aminotransferase class V-fold PLP-dependent enzyme [Actinomycetota bacterium]|nr:aminotransferase class V-fold PLP-dependent enzyme [Actinomycetota bacterium]
MNEVSRRAFLGRTGLAAGGLAAGGTSLALLAGCTDSASQRADDQTAAPLDPQDWDSVRAQFALRTDRMHFSAWGLASPARSVRDAIAEHRQALDEDSYAALGRETELDGAAVNAAARYLRTDYGQIALTDSTTMGLALVYGGLRLQPGDEVLSSEHDFYSTQEALRLSAERSGATLRKIPLYESPARASVDEIVSRIVAAITPRTRVLALTWVHSGTGVKLPIAEVATAVAYRAWDLGVPRPLFCLDGVHGFGVENQTPGTLGCDILVSGTHKWLFGPRGTGIVWAKPPAWEQITPTIPSFDPESLGSWIRGVEPEYLTPGGANTPGGFKAFERRWAMTQAYEFMTKIGPDRVASYTHDQARQLMAGLDAFEGVHVVTPQALELHAGLVCIQVAGGRSPFALAERLLERNAIVSGATPYRLPYLRLGTSIVTNPDQVDRVISAVAELL